MTVPLILLAGLTLVTGFIVFKPVGEAIGLGAGFTTTIENVLSAEPPEFSFDFFIAVISTAAVVVGLLIGFRLWSGAAEPGYELEASHPALFGTLRNKFYIDDFYQWCINKVVLGFAKVIAYFDREVVNDTGINGPGHAALGLGWVTKLTQTGKLPNYALAMGIGVAVLAIAGFAVKG